QGQDSKRNREQRNGDQAITGKGAPVPGHARHRSGERELRVEQGSLSRRALNLQAATQGLDTRREVTTPRSRVDPGAAAPVIAPRDQEPSGATFDRDRRAGSLGVLPDIGQLLGTDEVGGGLERGRKATVGDREADRDRSPGGEV